jgi:hypothetical protein
MGPSRERAVLEDANGGGVGELSEAEADGIWIEASLGVWSATAIEVGSAGPMSVPAEDYGSRMGPGACRWR